MATFNETCTPTSREYIVEQCIVMPNWSKTFQTFWSHSSVFALEKQPKHPISQSLFISNRPFGGYFQWNLCTYFQKICIWTRYSDATLMKIIWNFFVAFHSFCFRKEPKNLNFQNFFTSNRPFGDYVQWNASTYFQKKWILTRQQHSKLSRET